MKNDEERILEARQRYAAAMHGVQTGIAYEMEHGSKETEPKHLRVGVNSALLDSGALATLLMRKGVITEVEYFETLAEFAERELTSYEERAPKGIHFR